MSRRLSSAMLVCALFLAACIETGSGARPATRLAVAGGQIIAAVPADFCIDVGHSAVTSQSAVVLAERCGASPAAKASSAAVLTLSFGAPGSSAALRSGARALSDWVRSPKGRAALARDGRAGSVHVAETVVAGGTFLFRLTDRGVGEHWRALVGIKGRLVTLSVTAPKGSSLPEAEGRGMLDRGVAALRAAN